MAYTINNSDGSILGTVSDTEINVDDADIVLIGRNYKKYGEIINENCVWMLENFANTISPARPLEGQLWWSKNDSDLKIYNGTYFVSVKGVIANTDAPINPANGDLWWNTETAQLYGWAGASWILIGPKSTPEYGTTGEDIRTLIDTNGISHLVVFGVIDGVDVSVYSKDNTFTPEPPVSNFGDIYPGLNFDVYRWVNGAGVRLGGDFDTNNYKIISSDSANIQIDPDSIGKTYIIGQDGMSPYTQSEEQGDVLILANQGDSNLRMFSGAGHNNIIKFADSDQTFSRGAIEYNHSNGSLGFYVNRQNTSDITKDLSILSSGALFVGTIDYEDLVVSDDVVPNKKYVDVAIAAAIAAGSGGDLYVDGTGEITGDFTVGGDIYITNADPALYLTDTSTNKVSYLLYDANVFNIISPSAVSISSIGSTTLSTSAGGNVFVNSSGNISLTTSNSTTITTGVAVIDASSTVTVSGTNIAFNPTGTFKVSGNKIWRDTDNIEWVEKSTTFTAALSTHYICTCGTSYTITLPSNPAIGDWVVIKMDDQAEDHNITLNRNGKNIARLAENLIIDINYIEVRLAYNGATYGWAF